MFFFSLKFKANFKEKWQLKDWSSADLGTVRQKSKDPWAHVAG